MNSFRFPYFCSVSGLIITMLFFSACSHTPKGIIPEKKMREVLIDMQMAETIINENPKEYASYNDRNALFQSVFKKYQLTEAEYDSSLMWYGRNIDIYMQVYDNAMQDIDNQMKTIGDVKAEAINSPNADSVDIWIDKKYYTFADRYPFHLLTFELKPSMPYSQGSEFVWEMSVWGITSEMQQPLELHLKVDQADTTLIVKSTISKDGPCKLILKSLPTSPVQRVYGYIRMKPSSVSFDKIYIDKLQLMKYQSETIADPAIASR